PRAPPPRRSHPLRLEGVARLRQAALADRKRLERVAGGDEGAALLPTRGLLVDPRSVGLLERGELDAELLAPLVRLAVGAGHRDLLARGLLELGEAARHRAQVVIVALRAVLLGVVGALEAGILVEREVLRDPADGGDRARVVGLDARVEE